MKRKPSEHRKVVEKYIRDVEKGTILAGELIRAMIERHLNDLKHAGLRGYYFDPEAACAAIDWFPLLKHSTGEFAGKPFELEPWQKCMTWILFGWRRTSDGLRRFSRAFLSMGRGNGKSPFAAGLALLLFCFDYPIEVRAEVVCAATKKKQARIVWDEARRFIDELPSLKKRIEFYDSTQTTKMMLSHDESVLEVMEYSPTGHDGQVLHGAIVDELHAWRSQHRLMLDNLETAMSKRKQPLMIIITTAGGDESVLWNAEYEHCLKIVRQIVPADDTFVAIYQLDEEDDLFEERNWIKANPNLGVSVQLDGLRAMAEKSKSNPETKRKFRRYHCNLKTASITKAIPKALWDTGNRPLPDLSGLRCHAGLDLGWRDDLAALVGAFPLGMDLVAIICKCWMPEDCRRDLTEEPWSTWIEQGHLAVTSGNTTDPEAIYAEIAEWKRLYQLETLALDPNNARAVGVHLVNTLDVRVFEFYQTCRKYNEPIREFLRALEESRIIHGGHPILGFAAANLVTKADAQDYVMPAKNKSVEKIDPIVAAFMAYSELLFGEKEGGSAYDSADGGEVLF